MSKASMQIQLSWTDPETGTLRQPLLETPVALGREFTAMPGVLDGQRVSRVVLADDRVEPFQALIVEQDGELLITNQVNRNPLQVNGVVLPSSTVLDGDRIQIGAVQVQIFLQGGTAIEANRGTGSATGWQCDRMIGFLFKRRCTRTSAVGCPDCNNGQSDNDPYFYDRTYYPDYGVYGHGHWGSSYYYRDYAYDPETRSVDFTEADAQSFESEADGLYEQDMGAS